MDANSISLSRAVGLLRDAFAVEVDETYIAFTTEADDEKVFLAVAQSAEDKLTEFHEDDNQIVKIANHRMRLKATDGAMYKIGILNFTPVIP